MEENLGESQIRKSFAGTNILLTGGTGFLGKLLIEKLMRSCPELNKLYLLARKKKDKDPQTRLKEQFDGVLYETLQKEQPDFIKKVEILEGELVNKNLGLSDQDWLKVCNEVNYIFHGAATIRFDETLDNAVRINTRGTREMLMLARCCKGLKAFVYISTAYCNVPRQPIDEKFYDTPLDGDLLIDFVESLDGKTIESVTPGLIGSYPNTYCFTKAAAENVILKYSQGLPVAVLRPSIVISTAKGPIPLGWTDNIYGPNGICAGIALGIVRVNNLDPDAVADLVPADLVVNACIAIAWKTAKDHVKRSELNQGKTEYENNGHDTTDITEQIPRVYNYVSGEENPITWELFMHYAFKHGTTMALSKAVWCYMILLIKNRLVFKILNFFLHWIPAYLCDGVAFVIGKKPILRKVYTKIDKFMRYYNFFSSRGWKITNTNTVELYKELNETDRQIFDFDMSALDWDSYMYNYLLGGRLYVIKDPIETIPRGIKRQKFLKMLNYPVMTIYALVLVWIAVILSGGVLKIMYKILS